MSRSSLPPWSSVALLGHEDLLAVLVEDLDLVRVVLVLGVPVLDLDGLDLEAAVVLLAVLVVEPLVVVLEEMEKNYVLFQF